jgi:hypothetical protein
MVALNRVIVTMMIQLNTYHCNVVACSIWRVIRVLWTYLAGTDYMKLITSLEFLLDWEHLLSYDFFGYVEIIWFLMVIIILVYLLFTGVCICFFHGDQYYEWWLATCLWRCVDDWFLSHMEVVHKFSLLVLYVLRSRCDTCTSPIFIFIF